MKINRENFFNLRYYNNWDIGWPCSPRFYLGTMIILIEIIFIILFLTN